jgi:subtilisin family serine protease
MGRSRRGAASALAVTVAAAVAYTSFAISGATAQITDPIPVPAGGQDTPGTQSVTLLTGDRVTVSTAAGSARRVSVESAPGRDHIAFIERHSDEGHLSVIPSDAIELVAAGRLDPRLFDVSGLIKQGYDDAAAESLPLIVQYEDKPAAHAAVSADLTSAGAEIERRLPSISGAAAHVPKQSTAQLWNTLSGADDEAAGSLDAGVATILLDGKVAATLDESVPMIGVPEAWGAGYTGAGVRVAVLDSGLDVEHPDVGDAVTAAADFSSSDHGIADLLGHGTHVSSIALGRGTASSGRYTGVAPDAELLVGKVLNDSGFGRDSWAIAGMEWAVDQDAAVVNLSLGSCATDGSDPMADAVNTLTEQSGTLFVVAAGNHPSNCDSSPETVASPASADRAIAVGSVNKQGELSEFSNIGPRLGDGAVKPELTAPGESIVAARADGTFDDVAVGDHYARLSGTSMAAPHVAGIAALLAEQHPDWDADELGPALLASAVPHPDLGAYQQGAGRVDARRALGQEVFASPASLSMGVVRWPHDDVEPISSTLTYRNTGDETVTLDLSIVAFDDAGASAPDGLFDVTPIEITVPAGDDAEVTVTADPSIDSPSGAFSGWISGQSADGTAVITTPIGVVKEAESYDLTVVAIDRDGEPAFAPATVGDPAAESVRNFFIEGEPVTLRLPAGLYDLNATIRMIESEDPLVDSYTLAAVPEINLDQDVQVQLDAREGRLVTANVDSPTARAGVRRMFLRGYGHERQVATDWEPTEFYATPTVEVTAYDFTFGYQTAMGEPLPDIAAGKVRRPLPRGYQLFLTESGRIPDNPAFRVRDTELARLNTTVHSQGTDDLQHARLIAYPALGDGSAWGQQYDVHMPSERIDLYSGGADISWATDLFSPFVEENDYYGPYWLAYDAGGRYDKHWNAAPMGPVARPWFAFGHLFASLSPFSSSSYRHRTEPGWDGIEVSTTVKKDGDVVGTSDEPGGGFYELPAEFAAYEISMSARRNVEWSALATEVDATWTVIGQPDGHGMLPTVSLRISGDVDMFNQAPFNRPFRLDLVADRADGQEADVREISLQVSFDDGTTWEDVRTRSTKRGHTARVPSAPAGSEFVSLRATAEDVDGSRVEQTVIRAYQLAARHRSTRPN